VLNYASEHFARHLPIVYVLTVVGKKPDGKLAIRGLYIGNDMGMLPARGLAVA
jgi:hypothetical protein